MRNCFGKKNVPFVFFESLQQYMMVQRPPANERAAKFQNHKGDRNEIAAQSGHIICKSTFSDQRVECGQAPATAS